VLRCRLLSGKLVAELSSAADDKPHLARAHGRSLAEKVGHITKSINTTASHPMDEFYSRSGPVYYKVSYLHHPRSPRAAAQRMSFQSYEWYWLTLWSAVGVVINTIVALFLPLWYLGGMTAVRWRTFVFAASFVIILNGLIQFFIPGMLFNGVFVSDFM